MSKENNTLEVLDIGKELSKFIPGYALKDVNVGNSLKKYFDNNIISDTFALKLKFFMNTKNITGKEIGLKLGVTEATVINWSNAHRKPKDIYGTAKKLSEIFNVAITEFLPDTLKQRELITKQELQYNLDQYESMLPKTTMPPSVKKVSLRDGYVGAGSSGLVENETVVDEIYVDINMIAKRYRDCDIGGFQVVGDSMSPYVDSGDIVLYTHIESDYPRVDGKYIIRINSDLMVKNIKFKLNGDIIISSENKSYSDDIIKAESQEHDYFSIVGVVAGRILKG